MTEGGCWRTGLQTRRNNKSGMAEANQRYITRSRCVLQRMPSSFTHIHLLAPCFMRDSAKFAQLRYNDGNSRAGVFGGFILPFLRRRPKKAIEPMQERSEPPPLSSRDQALLLEHRNNMAAFKRRGNHR